MPASLFNKNRAEAAAGLKRREVFPGYHTMVDDSRHLDYERQHGEFAIFHNVSDSGMLPKIIKSGGLMSSHERYSRGLLVGGESTEQDFQTGGADSVFVRTVVEGSEIKRKPDEEDLHRHDHFVIMGPELYDRTDWYAYPKDLYGCTDTLLFNRFPPVSRRSPSEPGRGGL